MVTVINLDIKLTGKDTISVFCKRLKFVLARIHDHWGNKTDTFCNLTGYNCTMAYSTGKNDCINLSTGCGCNPGYIFGR